MSTPNKITIIRICLIPLFVLFLTPVPSSLIRVVPALKFINIHGLTISIIIFIIAAGTDKLDGYIARKYNQVTNLGILLDPLADKVLVTAALICLVQRHEVSIWISLIIIGREFLVTAIRLVATSTGVVLSADKYGKLKFVFQVGAILLALLNNYPLSLITSFRFDYLAMNLTAVITVVSGVNYIARNSNLFKQWNT